MRQKFSFLILAGVLFTTFASAETSAGPQTPKNLDQAAAQASRQEQPAAAAPIADTGYRVGVNDILSVAVLQPDPLNVELTVSPDGMVTFPYIGTVEAKGMTLIQIQDHIQKGLTDYMKYPVVAVSLKESRSRTFFVYGEVHQPGSFFLEKDMSVIQAISMAGGFTRVASIKDVKILRRKPDGSGNVLVTVDVNAIMTGKNLQDVKVEPGDVITVSQRFF